jgi:uncharacterized protein YejL (UPF0352 family)
VILAKLNASENQISAIQAELIAVLNKALS